MAKKTNLTNNFLDDVVKQVIAFEIILTKGGDGVWESLINFSASGSRDGEHFGVLTTSVKSFDNTSDNAVATAMLHLANFVGDPNFLPLLNNKILEAETS
jgi:hypothetical protein